MSEPHTPNPADEDQLAALGREIDDIRDRVDDPLDQGDATFVDGGDGEGPQDDTIVRRG